MLVLGFQEPRKQATLYMWHMMAASKDVLLPVPAALDAAPRCSSLSPIVAIAHYMRLRCLFLFLSQVDIRSGVMCVES